MPCPRIPVLARLVHRARRPHPPGRGTSVLVAVTALAVTAGAGYTVQGGDTLSDLAHRYGTTVSRLTEANDISDPDLIHVGQTLTIPGSSSNTQERPRSAVDPTTHVVRPGESLGSIAARFGLPVEDLARANGITNPSLVMAGALLRIAGDAPPPPGVGGDGSAPHIVAPGQALSTIAARYGTSVQALVDANELADPDRIVAGQRLDVPGATGTAWTCPWTSSSYVNDFGVAKPDGRYHEGIDVFAPGGSEIRAPVSGTVEQVTGSRAGKQFTLRGDDGYTYIGAHMASFGAAGRVEAGAVIGTVGDSGNAKGSPPHTHLEMHNGGVVNPYPTLQQYCG